MTTVADIIAYMESIAPVARKESWDNTGFQLGRRNRKVNRILIALDPFQDVAEEAVQIRADMIITHHPLLFFPTTAITDETPIGRTILTLTTHDIAAYSAHTNLDIAPIGVNDVLANTLELKDISVLNPVSTDEKGDQWGLLHCGTVPKQALTEFLSRAKEKLHTPVLRFADGGKTVHKVAVGGGACASEFREVIKAGCDTFVTSDAKYNDFWDAHDLGLNLIDAGHFYTENPVCERLQTLLQAAFPTVHVAISKTHGDCMQFY